jgi:hypothetical protein
MRSHTHAIHLIRQASPARHHCGSLEHLMEPNVEPADVTGAVYVHDMRAPRSYALHNLLRRSTEIARDGRDGTAGRERIMNRRVVAAMALVLIALVVGAAVGTTAYRAGVMRGLAEAGRLPVPDPGTATLPYGYYGPFWAHGPWGFAPWGFLFPLLFIGVLFVLLRGLFWGRGCGGHGPWSTEVPPRFEEWHRRAHESPPPGNRPSA